MNQWHSRIESGWAAVFLVAAFFGVVPVRGAQRVFVLGGVSVTLEEVTADTAVYYTSMRLNRALNVWNVEAVVSNRSVRVMSGPLVVAVDSATGTSGLQPADGVSEGNGFVDFSGQLSQGVLAPGQLTGRRTLSLGMSNAVPTLGTRVYAAPVVAGSVAAFLRTLNDAGQPLGGVSVGEVGPAGQDIQQTDPSFGVATVGQGAGDHLWKFTLDGFLPVWRRQTLGTGGVDQVISPRLTPRSTNTASLTPIGGGVLSNATFVVTFAPGAVGSNQPVTLTPLTAQTLPALLPSGWSPLQAFWLELPGAVSIPPNVSLYPWGPFNPGETGALAQWNSQTLQWEVRQLIASTGTNAITTTLPGAGAFALVVPDAAPSAPPAAQMNQPLSPATTTAPNASNLSATGDVVPSSSPASLVPELVTGTATVIISNSAGPLPSGLVLRCDVQESYQMQDGTSRVTPQYENFIVGFQRPGDALANTLQAVFPIRPLRLFGADVLNEAIVHVDVQPPGAFGGALLTTNGGLIASGGVRLLAGAGDLSGPQAALVRSVDPTNYATVAGGYTVIQAFDLNAAGVVPGHELSLQVTNAPPNAYLAVARVFQQDGVYGLEPVERLVSDSQGRLSSLETNATDRLPGITGAGQYVLLQLDQPQTLVKGIARNALAQPAGGLLVRLGPWTTMSRVPDGAFLLIAPAGTNQLVLTDLSTDDSSQSDLPIAPGQAIANPFLTAGSVGPRVVSITPTNAATGVPLVTAINIIFSKPLNPGTLLGNGAQLLGASNQIIVTSLSLNLANTTASLLPAATLDAATTYTVVLATNILDASGRPLEGDLQFTFTTVGLSARDSAAQLIIYQPGATNVPTNVVAQIPGYVPGADPDTIVVQGSPGVADPRVAVVLANESSGETSTVLSKADGSFVSVIRGAEEDFVSATFINLNGTRVYVPVSRQLFDNGFVGLYRQGGILEAESDGGPVQVFIQPEAVQSRAKFRIQTLSADALSQELGGVAPESGTVAANAVKMEVSGEQPSGPVKVSFPVNLTAIGFPTNLAPQDAALALTIAQDVDGVKAFEVRDQLRYVPQSLPRPGTVHAQDSFSEKYEGAISFALSFVPGADIFQFVIVPLLIGSQPIVVAGKTLQAPSITITNQVGANASLVQELSNALLTGVINDALAEKYGTPLSGSFITLRQSIAPAGRAGRLNPGMVYSTSGQDGKYMMVAPLGDAGYVITATHPKFEDKHVEPVFPLYELTINGVARKNFVFFVPSDLQLAPQVNIARSPLFPAPGQDCVVQITASQGIAPPPNVNVVIKRVLRLADNADAPLTAVTLTTPQVQIQSNVKKWTATLQTTNAVRVVLTVDVTSASGSGAARPPFDYPIDFAGVTPPPPSGNPIPPSDTNATVGPVVVASFPPEGGYVTQSGEIRLRFNEPIDQAAATNANGIILSGPGASLPPHLELSADQKELVLTFAGLQPGGDFSLSVSGLTVRDLRGNPLDQKPSTKEADSFTMTFHTTPMSLVNLPEVQSGFGVVVRGNRLYALDRSGPNYLMIYDISVPSQPQLLSRTIERGMPRDLVLIPQYAYKLKPQGPVFINDLVAVVGGDLVTHNVDTNLGAVTTDGQYLRIYNVGDPGNPVPLATLAVTYRLAAVTKIRWEAPNLSYLEFGLDLKQIGVINLQELLIGFNATPAEQDAFPDFGDDGVDKNGDGDYVDPGERVPLPLRRPPEFYGKKQSYVVENTTQNLLDFSFSHGTLGITLSHGQKLQNGVPVAALNPAYRTVSYFGQQVSLEGGTYNFTNQAFPKRVTVFPALPIRIQGQLSTPVVALVSLSPDADGKEKLAVLDITLPESPKLIQAITIQDELAGGFLESVILGEDGVLQLATSQNLIRLNPLLLAEPNPANGGPHPAIMNVIPNGGSDTFSFGTTPYGVLAVNEGGRHQLVQVAPPMSFVTFPDSTNVVNPTQLPTADTDLQALLDGARVAQTIYPARREATLDVASDLSPPSPRSHYHVLIQAPGGGGTTIQVGLESLNRSGKPLGNLGLLYPPTRAETANTLTKLKQTPRDCDAPIRPLTAYRMSNDPQSPFYNRYLSKPFALSYEKVSVIQLQALQTELDREILWSGGFLRAFLDPDMAVSPTVGSYAAQVSQAAGTLFPLAGVVAQTLDVSYIMGDNPPPAGGFAALPGTSGMVSAHNGELRTETMDFMVPSPRMPIVFQRAVGNQDTYSGQFGRGWDFNYNQRLTELDPSLFPEGLSMPLIVRGTKADSEVSGSHDVLFHTGAGRTMHFSHTGTNVPPEYAQDPLVLQLDWPHLVADYFLPEKGSFDLLVKFKDGYFERLTPDGVRFRYANNGRLEQIIDRFPKNRQEFEYDRRGLLIRITDRSVTADRFLEIGYYRFAADPDFTGGLDTATDNAFWDGKVCRLRDYAGGDVLFVYNDDGILIERDGVALAGENGGFSGRIQTHYIYDGCQIRGIAQTAQGKPVFVGLNANNSTGKPVTQSGNGGSGDVKVNVALENSAAKLDNSTSSATEANGTTTTYKFNKKGYPTSVSVSGGKGVAAESTQDFNDDGQVTFVKYPEGNTQTMVYDTNNLVFRSRGNLVSVTVDPGPRAGTSYTETFNYDPLYNLPSGAQKDANGFIRTYQLTTDGREVASIQHGAAGSDVFGYDDNGQLTSRHDYRGIETSYTYDSGTGFAQTEQRGGNVYTYSYGGDYASQLGRPASFAPPLGTPTLMKHNADLQEVEVARGDEIERFAYDDQGRAYYHLELLGDGKQRANTLSFDDKGFLTNSTIAGIEVNGVEASLSYDYAPDEVSRVKTIKTPSGMLQSFEYDDRGNITKTTLGSYVEEYGRDLHGNVLTVKQGGDLVETMAYDGLDRVTATTHKTGTADEVESSTYYQGGELQSHVLTDPQFGVVQEETIDLIDEVGRPLQVNIHGGVISPGYQNTYGSRTHTVAGPRLTSTTTWNTAGEQTGYSDPVSSSVISPDANGRVKQQDWLQDGVTYSDFYVYDGLDHQTSVQDNLGLRSATLPRADGLSLAVTNARGFVTTMDYSAMGELLKQHRSDGMEERYQHSPERQVSYAGDPNAGFSFVYDDDLRLKQRTLRNGAAIAYAGFDPRNLPTSITLPGGTMTLTYDLQRRLTKQTVTYQFTSREENFTYDALGRVRVETYRQDAGAVNTATYTYDKAGPLLSARFQEDGADYTVAYGYYADGVRKSVTYPSGVTVNEERDVNDRLITVSDASGNLSHVTQWKGKNQPAVIQLGASMQMVNQFDVRGRLTGSRVTRLSDGAVLTHLRFQYDPDDNVNVRQFLHRGGEADVFGYDAGERVLQAQLRSVPTNLAGAGPALVQRNYYYAAAGLDFLTSVTTAGSAPASAPPFASSWSAQDAFLLPTVVDSFARGPADPMGNVGRAQLQVRPAGASAPLGLSATIEHNGLDSLIRITRSDAVVLENQFQPGGIRYSRKVSQGQQVTLTAFVYDDDGRLIEEYDRSGSPQQLIGRYFYASGDAPIAADLRDNGGQLHRYYYLRDDVQSVIAVADDAGNVVERVRYDTFGQPVIEARDTVPPVIQSIVADAGSSLLIAMSEPVSAPLPDPGPGSGVVAVSNQFGTVFTLVDNSTQATITGAVSLVEFVPGFDPRSVLRFTPAQSVTGAVSVTLSAGTLADEWGNTNAAQTVTATLVANAPTGSVFYAAQPQPHTAPPQLARSGIGSPFLFQGQYFDYDAGLLYLRARFYDPFSAMFFEPDPDGYNDSVNLYAAFLQNPVTRRDPSGHSTADIMRIIARVIRKQEMAAGKAIDRDLLRSAVRVERSLGSVEAEGGNLFKGLSKHWDAVEAQLAKSSRFRKPGGFKPFEEFPQFAERGENDLIRHLEENGFLKVKKGDLQHEVHPLAGTGPGKDDTIAAGVLTKNNNNGGSDIWYRFHLNEKGQFRDIEAVRIDPHGHFVGNPNIRQRPVPGTGRLGANGEVPHFHKELVEDPREAEAYISTGLQYHFDRQGAIPKGGAAGRFPYVGATAFDDAGTRITTRTQNELIKTGVQSAHPEEVWIKSHIWLARPPGYRW